MICAANIFGAPTDEQFRRQQAEEAEKAAFNALPLIEQNAIKLAELEREWSTLGSTRAITFRVVFYEPEGANSLAHEVNSLAHDAREEGFDVDIAKYSVASDSYDYELNATRLMEPITENVTLWEEWFRTRASDLPDSEWGRDVDFKGWSYPERLTPSFFLKGDKSYRNDHNAEGARDRTRVLFGQNVCDFEASNGWSSKKSSSRSSPTFKLVPSDFLKHASSQRPSNPAPTASMFSQWLYSLYANAFGDAQDRAEGKVAEEFILAERRRAYASTDYNTMRTHFPDWRLKHNGMSVNQSDRPNYYSIDDLVVRGEPLRVLPDLIYENRHTREIIVVEIKHSQMDIPSNLWPNIWGQLWCYSQMQELRDSPKVTVIGEVWGDKYRNRGEVQDVYLRASVRRNPRAIPYDRFFRALFDIYRGAD